MKVHKTQVFRLEIERDCGCKASREYDDPRYQKPKSEGVTSLCEKHLSKSADAQEILAEMLLDTLGVQAETAGKTYAPVRQVAEGDTGGLVATGESVQALGVQMPERQPNTVKVRQKPADPTAITKVSVDRSDPRVQGRAPAPADLGNLNVAGSTDLGDGITATGSIETVTEDPRLSNLVADELEGALEDALDAKDMELNGVPRSALAGAKD